MSYLGHTAAAPARAAGLFLLANPREGPVRAASLRCWSTREISTQRFLR